MTRLAHRVIFEILRLLDQLFPGWSGPRVDGPDFGRPLTHEAVTYWLTDERCRRHLE